MARLLEVGLACKVDHRRWSAHKDESLSVGRRQVLRHHILIDEAGRVLPRRLGRHVERIPDTHPRVRLERGEQVLAEDVLVSAIGEEDRDAYLPALVCNERMRGLQYGRDS